MFSFCALVWVSPVGANGLVWWGQLEALEGPSYLVGEGEVEALYLVGVEEVEALHLVGVEEGEDHQNHWALVVEEGVEVQLLLEEEGVVGEEGVHLLQVVVEEGEVLLLQEEVVVEEEEWKHCFDFPHYVF